jgi:pimeloyl-ACP methyl ester carboxylesterase
MPDSKSAMLTTILCALLPAGGSTLAASNREEPPAHAQNIPAQSGLVEIDAGSGSFLVAGGAGRESRTIEVHYYRPMHLTRESPVMMVVPGAGRNGDDYRDAWKEASERYGVLILSPSYSEKHYPEYWSYNLGNMPGSVTLEFRMQVDTNPPHWQFGDLAETADNDAGLDRLAHSNGLLYRVALLALAGMVADVDGEATGLSVNRDRSTWIYADFDRIFEAARHALDLEADSYDMFGHSAGGQILHRFVLFHPDNRANRILTSNSGWYTLPDFNEAFPYGLENTGMNADEIRRAFRARLVVFLGEKDDENETRGDLRATPEANQQGPGRLQRGRYFFANAQAAAKQLDANLQWKLEIVPGIGHDYRRMSTAASEYLYGKRSNDGRNY